MTHRYDLAVIGGGIAGTLAVLAAETRGLDVVWIADRVGPDAQSAHWHGHLHRGRLYDPVRETDLIAELHQNVPFWWSDAVTRFHTPLATVALGHEEAWAEEFRRRVAGVPDAGPWAPSYARDDVLAVRTDEAVLDGPAFLGTARELAGTDSTFVAGVAERVRRTRSGDWEVQVEDDAVAARRLIVATGICNPRLTPASVRLSCNPDARLARMLVLRGGLPPAAAIIPSRAAGGLFFDSREIPSPAGAGERVWLVSDGFSSPGSVSPSALTDGWWACSIVERLRRFVRADLLDSVQVTAYRAPKSRVESSPTEVPGRGFAVDQERAFVSLMPAKWSAAPTSAVEALGALIPDALPLAARIERMTSRFPLGFRSAVAPFQETWELQERWAPLPALTHPGSDALRAAASIFASDRSATADRSVA